MSSKIIQTSGNIAKAVEAGIKVLSGGGIIAFPTETVYGLGVDSENRRSVDSLFRLKGRRRDKPFSLHVASVEQIDSLGFNLPRKFYDLAEKFFPGPLSIIVEINNSQGATETVGFRAPDNPFAIALIEAFGRPLYATSANPSGKPPATNAEKTREYFGARLPVIFDSGECLIGQASTTILIGGESYRVLRRGAVKISEIEKICGKLID